MMTGFAILLVNLYGPALPRIHPKRIVDLRIKIRGSVLILGGSALILLGSVY